MILQKWYVIDVMRTRLLSEKKSSMTTVKNNTSLKDYCRIYSLVLWLAMSPTEIGTSESYLNYGTEFEP